MNLDQLNTSTLKYNDVISIGEILIDVIDNDDNQKKLVAGSPYNICRNLTMLGIKNKFYGAIGTDNYANLIKNDVKQRNLDVVLNETNGKTSSVMINQTYETPIPTFHRESDNQIHLTSELLEDVSGSKILHFTFWPLSKNPSRDTMVSLVLKAKANNTLIGLDPNYHQDLDDLNKDGLKTIKEIIEKADIIKPSIDDSERLFGKKTVDQYLEIYEQLGAKLIIITLGKDGLVAKYNGKVIRMPSVATEIVDSTGAGDAFWSGLYAGIINELSIEKSLKLGLHCSALCLKTVGSTFELPRYESLLKKIGD
ncbi:MAG: carbohydrate kinase [Tenericutes bacterium]|nr:carbohydrate kinase [Mycoplasmatota bacterium]